MPWGRQRVVVAGTRNLLRPRGYAQGYVKDPGMSADKKPGDRGKCEGSFPDTLRAETGCGVMGDQKQGVTTMGQKWGVG